MTFCMVILIDPREFLADCIAQNKYNLLSLTTLKCKQTIALTLVLSFYNNYYYCLLFYINRFVSISSLYVKVCCERIHRSEDNYNIK